MTKMTIEGDTIDEDEDEGDIYSAALLRSIYELDKNDDDDEDDFNANSDED